MKHLDDGQLRAHLDGELDKESAQHLDGCPDCQHRFSMIKARAGRLEKHLAFLDASASLSAGRTPAQALSILNKQLDDEKEVPLMNKSFIQNSARYGLPWQLS